VRRDGRRGTLLTVLKAGDASTLDVVDNIRAAIRGWPPPSARAEVETARLTSHLRAGAISGVIHEAIIAACLTG